MDEIENIEIINAAMQVPKWWNPWIEVIYIDTPKLLSFDIFEGHGIRPRSIKVADNPEEPYVGVLCKIRKKHFAIFLHCMAALRRTILITGNNDYDDYCKKFINEETVE